MKKLSILTFLFICAFVNLAVAQVGYIITQKGDTIKGELNIGTFGGGKFKPINKPDFVSVKIDTLKEYQLSDSSVYVLRVIPGSGAKPQILQGIEHGRINLYQYETPAGATSIIAWYASKGTDSLIKLKTSNAFFGGISKKEGKATLSGLFADQPDIQKTFDASGKFDFATIQAYIRKYNKAANGAGK